MPNFCCQTMWVLENVNARARLRHMLELWQTQSFQQGLPRLKIIVNTTASEPHASTLQGSLLPPFWSSTEEAAQLLHHVCYWQPWNSWWPEVLSNWRGPNYREDNNSITKIILKIFEDGSVRIDTPEPFGVILFFQQNRLLIRSFWTSSRSACTM